ncbi:hypothetical protein COCNU_08G002140 [Cocos nucifera]|uniref:TLDc domain-containing protein n=1 Tax=Cocos nucifera TaxID=13894 RepID=A0A8K0N5D7_COCNU|nr:hypothetical protein COCNU_08G002140 [Cocos nucifera]
MEGRDLKCCYRASIDGFSATKFHNCCDFKGPCVVIGYSTKSFKFGAFNPEGYRSTDDYYDTFDAFLFYWKEAGEGGADEPIILPKVGGSGAALFDYARGGPQFGADGLLIGPPLAPVMGGFAGPDTNSGIGDLRQAKSRLGLSYAKREDGKESLFGDESRASLVEVQSLQRRKKLFVHFVLDPVLTSRSSGGASFAARYGCLVLIESIKQLEIGALVSIRGIGRVRIVELMQMHVNIKNLAV